MIDVIKGPWSLEVGDHTHRYVLIKDSDDFTVFYKYAAGNKTEADRDEARARLASSAPELLEALAEACEVIADLSAYANNNGGMIDDETFSRGLDLIAKVTKS